MGAVLAVVLVVVLFPDREPAAAQTLTYRGTVGTTVASTQGQPLWLRANEYGRIDPASANGYVRGAAVGRTDTSRVWGAQVGASLLGRWSAAETLHFSQLYTKLRYRFVRFSAGRWHDAIGPVNAGALSTGSLMQSRNATPIPMISAGTAGYVGVPFTKGFVQVKGHYAHGWFDDRRFVDNVYLHRKAAYLRLGAGRRVSATMGLVHSAQWGGTSPQDGTLPQGLADYRDVVFTGSGGEGAPEGEQVNVLGNHLGIFDLGATVRGDAFTIRGYHQHLFEDGSGYDWENVPDGLYGIRWTGARWSLLDTVQYEFLYTENQSGTIRPPGRDDYYNNFVYRSGWTSNGALLGSPLFLYEPSRIGRDAVYSNRIVAHHLGVEGHITARFRYRAVATWMRHAGTFDYPFRASQTQVSTLLEVRVLPFPTEAIEVGGAVAVDTGEVFDDRVGVQLGITYSGQQR
jgi:hypothetical protein